MDLNHENNEALAIQPFPYNSDYAVDSWQHYFDYGTNEDGESIATCLSCLECNETLFVEQTIVLGVFEGDLQLISQDSTKERQPIYSVFEIFRLDIILGNTGDNPALMSQGVFEIYGVESDTLSNFTEFTHIDKAYSEKLSSLLENNSFSLAGMLKKLNMDILLLDEQSRQALSCTPHDRSLCENAEFCVRPSNSIIFKCICREGYVGKYCQFSLFPSTCTEALNIDPKHKPGIYQIDIDGSGPLRATFAECLSNGRTVVTHNAPNRTQIRSPNDTSHKYYPINYRLFSVLQLKGLKRRSARCEQTIRYECSNAPLDFENQMTWFESDENSKIYKLGSAAPENGCVCANKNQCHKGGMCNCDKTASSDMGTFVDSQAGIQYVYVKKLESDGNANITIGPLECYGDTGHDFEKTWTLKSQEAQLALGPKRSIRFFEMEFRTAQKDIRSLLSGDKIPGDKFEQLTISIIGGHRIEFKYTGQNKNISMSIMSQASLDDLKWHRLLIEIVRQEIRFSIDRSNVFHSANILNFNLQLKVGNSSNGFIGCVRGIRINNSLLPMRAEKYENKLVKQGCPNLCQQQKNRCEMDSRCIEHFDTNTTSCECKNNLIHYGERCEKNININSEVSFHDKSTGFLKFKNDELAANPLNTSMVFSVRTDQKRALFVYAHDQFDNFLQVHLENEYKIVLTLNNGTKVVNCAIYSEDSTEFSNMRWLQILIEQTSERISLHVDDAVCELTGPHVLADSIIEFYTGESGDAIFPPPSAATIVSIKPYQILFVGGVPRVALERYPRAPNELKKRERITYYVTDIPSILGCMRGFMLGELLDLRTKGIRPSNQDAVRVGCIEECKSLKCANGGHCAVRWQESVEKENEIKHTTCDCSKTSYYGEDCTKDTGVSFGGQAALIFNMTEPKRFFLDESEEQSFRFAFAPRAHKLLARQHLGKFNFNIYIVFSASILFEDKRQFIVDLCKNGSINVAIKSPRRTYVYTFVGNFTDGFRHFFQSSFIPGKPILVLIDGQKKFLDEEQQLHLADAREFWFGGNEASDEDELQHHNYEGCMSNIDIDFHKNEAVHFKPIIYYHDLSHAYHKSLRLHPKNATKLAASRCTRFKIPGSLPIEQRNIQYPIWEALFVSVPFNDSDDDIFSGSPVDKYDWLIFIGIGILSLAAILLCVFCCYYLCWPCICCKRDGKERVIDKRVSSSELRTRRANGRENNMLVDSITFVKPDVPLLSSQQKTSTDSRNIKEKTSSVTSSGTYFTATENQPIKMMTESQITAGAVDSDDETLTAYDDRPLSVISDPNRIFHYQSPNIQQERSVPTLSTFMGMDELVPDHPLPARFSPYLPSIRSTLRRSQPANINAESSPKQNRPIPVQIPDVPDILDSDGSLKDL